MTRGRPAEDPAPAFLILEDNL
ncbi:hypothetical protein EVAR_72874_1, partial [Eumeta japonica]